MSHLLNTAEVCARHNLTADSFRHLRRAYPLLPTQRLNSGPLFHPDSVASWWNHLPAVVRNTLQGRRNAQARDRRNEHARLVKRLMDFAMQLRKESNDLVRLKWHGKRAWIEREDGSTLRSFWTLENVFVTPNLHLNMARAIANPLEGTDTTSAAD